jgi:formyl-CoA transferase
VLVAGNGDSIFKRLMHAIGRDDLAPRPTWPTTPAAWRAWPRSTPPSAPGPQQRTVVHAVLDALGAARVPAGKVYTAKDIAEDPHYRARDMILPQATRDGYRWRCPASCPS